MFPISPLKTAFLVGLASVLPAGPFFADPLLHRHEKLLWRSGGTDDTTRADV